jgi:mRNA-degrading endonuclease RelE of RelBE toxin-antitoxin system
MIEPYEVFLRAEAIEVLRLLHPRHRKAIGAFIDSLAMNPFLEGDYSSPDATGRAISIKILGAFALSYWADHPAKEIKVIDIRSADRS